MVAVLIGVGVGAAGCGGGGGGSSSNDAGASGTGGTGGGGNDARTGTGGGSGDAAAITGALGTSCAATGGCGAGLTCLAAADKVIYGLGGPAHGYCTLPCTDTASSMACASAGGICVNLSKMGDTAAPYCMLRCTTGKTAATKCNGRSDIACVPLTTTSGAIQAACLPTCSQDSDCPAGRKCDDLSNSCVDTPNAGLPFGAHCTYDATHTMPNPCAGGCLPVGDSAGNVIASFCTRSCVVGQLDNCNRVDKSMPLSSGGPHGVCLSGNTTSGPGDRGVCLQQCDAVTDCGDQSDPNLICDLTQAAIVGHGICAWTVSSRDGGSSEVGVGGDGGTDAAGQ